ncbi:PAN-1 domain containing protein [Aphelenchoides fujianensis]|nr:PAN-1 domain containing protein [Aphelenchoides fujianensis]
MIQRTLLCASLLISFVLEPAVAKSCHTQSFFIQNNVVIEGAVLGSFSSDLNECAQRCKKDKQCTGANFLLSVDSEPHCLLVDTTRNGSANELPVASAVVYALKSFCLDRQTSCPNREWSFEKFGSWDLVDEKLVVGSAANSTVEQCLNLCARSHECEAVLFNRRTSACRLSKAKLNNVNSIRQYFKHNNEVDLFENNCPKRHFDRQKCNFVRINQAGFVDVFDRRLSGIKDIQQCEAECLTWRYGTCRSYTYNKKTRHCFLSHANQKALGRSVLDSLSEDLSSGELDDCINFELDCHGQSLTLTAKSLKLLKGSIRAKQGKGFLCEQKIAEDYAFSHDFPFDKCGIQRQDSIEPTFAGLLMFKEGSTDLITIHDKLVEVKCRIHDQIRAQQDNQLSFHFEVEDQNATTSLLGGKTTVPPARQAETFSKYKLDVLNADGQLADVVDVGQRGFLLITVDSNEIPKDEAGFIITELIAEDSVNFVELIDAKGCVTNTPIVKSLERVSPNAFRVEIEFGGYPDQAQVTYQTLVKPCKAGGCDLDCNAHMYAHNRTSGEQPAGGPARIHRIARRDLNRRSRHVALSEDVYRVKTTATQIEEADRKVAEILREGSSRTDLPTTSTPTKSPFSSRDPLQRGEGTGGNILQCFTEDLSCMFTMVLASLQILLMLSCFAIIYTYAKKWIRYYRTRRFSSFDGTHLDLGPDASFMDSQTSSTLNSSRLTSTTTTATAAHNLKK